MADKYIKSFIWLLSSGVLGYSLMILTAPSEEKLAKIRATAGGVHLSEGEKKKILFLTKLQEAANIKEPEYSKKGGN